MFGAKTQFLDFQTSKNVIFEIFNPLETFNGWAIMAHLRTQSKLDHTKKIWQVSNCRNFLRISHQRSCVLFYQEKKMQIKTKTNQTLTSNPWRPHNAEEISGLEKQSLKFILDA